MMTFDDVVGQVMALPEVESQAHFDQPAYRLRGKILVMLRDDEAGRPVAVLKPPADEIDAILADPATFARASSGGWSCSLTVSIPTRCASCWLRPGSSSPKRPATQHRQTLLGAPD